MADGSGVSGIAVGVVAIGGLLVASALRNVTPLDTLRTVIGRPGSGKPVSTDLGSVASGVRTVSEAGAAVGSAVGGVAGAAQAGRLVSEARKYLGVPYLYGGTSRKGIDCSGLVVLSFRGIGIDCPRFTTVTLGFWAKRYGAKKIGPAEFRAGDVICRPGHMAIAISPTEMIHAPHAGTVVKQATIYSKSTWYGWRFFG